MDTPTPPARRLSTLVAWVALALTLLGVAGVWLWLDQRESRALRSLPDQERQALYTRTMQNLETLCRPDRAPELGAFCSEQAEIALGLPECDPACRSLAHRFYRKPAR